MSEQEDVCAQARAAWKSIEHAAKQAGAKETSLRLAAIGVLTFVFEGAKKRRELEARIEALEAAHRDQKFCGVWQRALEYKRNNFVTFDGSLWVALRDTPAGSKPGDKPEDWQLCVKR